MTLHAHFHAPFGAQLCWIHYGRIYNACLAGRSNMLTPRTVTSLAIDPLGKIPEEDGVTAGSLVRGWSTRITVVTKHALIRNESTSLRTLSIGAGDHTPLSAFARVPAERQLNQHAALSPMQIRAGVVTRPHNIIDLQFFGIDLFAGGIQLPAALK